MSVVGYRNDVANTSAYGALNRDEQLPRDESFDDYLRTLREINHGLYPDDSTEKGKCSA